MGGKRFMRILRYLQAGVFLLGPALGSLSLMSGCGGGQPETGTQAKVDVKEQEDLQKRMQEFMAKKQGGGASKKAP
jgi:hypothetical protein